MVAFVRLSVMTGITITEAAVKEAGFERPAEAHADHRGGRQAVERVDRSLVGIAALAGWMLSVPSVEPAKYRSLGYGRCPAFELVQRR